MKHMFTFFEDFTEGADFYHNNGSLWLIFTEQKKWVFELTKDGTLWYNYYFFDKIFKFFSIDVVENQHYITKWVENFIQNGVKRTDGCQIGTSTSIEDTIQNGVKDTAPGTPSRRNPIEDTIQNGVKETFLVEGTRIGIVENTIQIGVKETAHDTAHVEDTTQNGVKRTKFAQGTRPTAVDDTVQNGVKKTKGYRFTSKSIVGDIIDNGVKQTHLGGKDRKIDEIKDIIENGVKETNMEEHHRLREVVQTVKNGIKETTPGGYLGSVEMKGKTVHQFESPKQNNEVEDVIENGVKETNPHFLEILNPINFEPVIKEMKRMNEVNIVLDKGIKEVKELPDKSGELRGYGDYYHRQEDRTKPHTKYVDDVITNGIKKTKAMDEWVNTDRILDGVIRDGVKETWGYERQPQNRINEVIKNGTKENPS